MRLGQARSGGVVGYQETTREARQQTLRSGGKTVGQPKRIAQTYRTTAGSDDRSGESDDAPDSG